MALEVISTHPSSYLADSIAKALGAPRRDTVRDRFENGERYYRVSLEEGETLAGKDVVVVGSTHTDTDLLEMYRVGYTLSAMGTRRRIFVIPFLGYSTMDRATKAGESVTAKTNARLLSAIPNSGHGNTFLLLDLHEPALLHYFEGDCMPVELSAEPLIRDAVATLHLDTFILGSADLGMPRQVKRLAGQLHTDIALISKSREFDNTSVLAAVGDVQDKTVVIYDDMIRSGSTLVHAAQAYMEHGAREVYAAASHAALTSPDVVQTLEQSSISGVITTDSHPMSQERAVASSSLFTVLKTSDIFAKAIQRLLS